jgi:cytochrome P450
MSLPPPGPRLPALLQAAIFLRDPIGLLRRCHGRYGDCFAVRLPGLGRVVYVADPGVVKEVLTGDPKRFHAGDGNGAWLEPVVGSRSLFTLDEEEHLRQRKLLLPPFHGERVRRYEEIIAAATERELERWQLGRPFALRPAMQRITLEVIQRAVIGIEEEDRREELSRAILRLERDAARVLPFPPLRRDLGPLSPWRRFLRSRARADELIYTEIARRRADPDAERREDVLSLLLGARHEDGSEMSDVELRDQIMTTVAAGYETTATALAWAFERLLRTPRVLERLVNSPDDAYLDAVVKETLRTRLPVTDGGTRFLTEAAELAGYSIPAGSLVLAAPWLLHFRPQTYRDPEAFRPERFLEEKPDSYCFVPFGGGVRRCIGAALAQLEMKVVLRVVLEQARLEAPSPKPEKPRMHHVVVVPARGARVTLTERLPAAAST